MRELYCGEANREVFLFESPLRKSQNPFLLKFISFNIMITVIRLSIFAQHGSLLVRTFISLSEFPGSNFKSQIGCPELVILFLRGNLGSTLT